VGSKQTVRVQRGDKTLDLHVKLAAMPSDLYNTGFQAEPEQEQPPAGNRYTSKKFGFTAEPLPADVAEQRKLKPDSGVLITEVEPEGKAADAGLSPGLAVIRVGNKPIHNVDEFRQALEAAADQPTIRLWVRSTYGSDLVILRNK
jgi:serine protease Do